MSTVFSDVQPNLALSSCGFFLLWMVANMATSQNWKPKKKTLLCTCKIQNRPQKKFFLDQRNERKNNQMSHVVAYVDIHVCCWITESHKSWALISNLYKRDWDLETLLPFCKPLSISAAATTRMSTLLSTNTLSCLRNFWTSRNPWSRCRLTILDSSMSTHVIDLLK